MPEINWTMLAWGCLGSLLPDILRIINARHELGPLPYLKSWTFWFGLLFLIFLGALANVLLQAANWKEAIAYGFSAPELLSRLLSKPAPLPVDRGEETAAAPPRTASPTDPIQFIRHWWAM